MALLHLVSLSLPCTTLPSKILPKQFHKTKASSSSSSLSIQCTKSNNINISTLSSPIVRRSADFQPTVWHYDFIQSLGSKYMEESNAEKWQVLKEEVRMMLCKKKEEEEPLHQLEFIDVLQRLGVAYHFETEIKNILENHYININKMDKLLKEVFDRFVDEMGNFKQILSADIKGMLSLYEASFLEVENESILKKAREFSIEILKEYVREMKENDFMSLLINHALEVPLHWRMQRWEALWFINAYERSPNVIPPLLQLAKLDFNMLQAIYQEELKHTSRWWKGIGLMENLSFARDRLVEGFVWAVGYNYMPQNAKLREVITKVLALMTTMDDIYDVYGTLEELELFTQAVDRAFRFSVKCQPWFMYSRISALVP
ncbi:terpene synthase 10-like [Senna tora]|uniref:Terpene synthase 10-like n=1 Tax=Senna tora TaxID=362788 RepID=A0A834X1D5_9FABA|nr:terpene synthase 10-like [Senna tora]